MTKDKQIEEMTIVLTEAQHAFDRAWKECLHNNAPMPDRENVFYAKYLVEKEGYRKSTDVAREIFEEIEKTAIQTYAELNSAPIAKIDERTHIFTLGKIKMLQDAYDFIAELKKKYTEEVK